MLFVVVTLLACHCTSVLSSDPTYYDIENAAEHFEYFIKEYNIEYADEQEKAARFEIFKDNLIDVNRINAENNASRSGGPIAVFAITKFMDLTAYEFESMYTGFGGTRMFWDLSSCSTITDNDITLGPAPESFDWRDQNAVSRVKNQGMCNSCYAFSSTGHLEAQYAIKYRKRVELSEQQIVDCDKRSKGCKYGGWMTNAFISIMEQGGIMSESDYPYTARDGRCGQNPRRAVLKISRCNTYKLRSQERLKQILYTTGPISIALRASNFQKYHGGVFRDEDCAAGQINHAVLLVGYGVDPKYGPYWLIKNSYGPDFGEAGYIRVQRGENAQSCGLMQEGMATAVIQ